MNIFLLPECVKNPVAYGFHFRTSCKSKTDCLKIGWNCFFHL